jgi:2-polyprenyl-3-methyl-5-hydroxy-6-metoxy-1,4-benzoquinol methylase
LLQVEEKGCPAALFPCSSRIPELHQWAMDTITAATYDSMPYPGYTIEETHPGRLAAMGKLHGLQAIDPKNARILELGCGTGINLLAMAQLWPEAELVGIDLAEGHIAEAREAARETGLESRVTFLREDLSEIRGDLGKFDMIICHGVYSWVPPAVRKAVLDLCRERLNPIGIAYVSYNALPGWRARGAIREMMLQRTEGVSDPRERVAMARALVDFLAATVPEELPHGKFLRNEAAYLRGRDDAYVAHDYLSPFNEAFYFRDFVKEAAAHGLGYLGDANPWSMRADDLPAATLQQLAQLAAGPVERGQYLDYIRDRTFRCTLLCHAAAARSAQPDPRLLEGLQVRGRLRLKEPYRNGRALFTTRSGAEIAVPRSSAATLFARIAELGAGGVRGAMESGELIREVLASLGGVCDGLSGEEALGALQRMLFEAFTRQLIDLTVGLPSPAGRPSPASHPKSLSVTRWQASRGEWVSAGDLGYLRIDELLRKFLALSDGTRNRSEIVAGLVEAFARGQITIPGNGGGLKDAAQVKALLASRYPAILGHLGDLGLMMREGS